MSKADQKKVGYIGTMSYNENYAREVSAYLKGQRVGLKLGIFLGIVIGVMLALIVFAVYLDNLLK